VPFVLPQHDEKTGRPILPKTELVDGAYYIGRCRNATVARWSAPHDCFFHWRVKFDRIFVEEIKHPIDENYFDVFRVVRVLPEPKFEIPLDAAHIFGGTGGVFGGRAEDLDEYGHEMWLKISVP
jgi:hypothetical protein